MVPTDGGGAQETHISILLFLGDRVLKIHKPVRFDFAEVPLLDGTYSVSVGVRSLSQVNIVAWKDHVTQFEVANPGRSTGRVRLPLDVSFRLRSTGHTGEVPVVPPISLAGEASII